MPAPRQPAPIVRDSGRPLAISSVTRKSLKRNDGPEVALRQAREIAPVLHQQRLVEAVGGVEIGANRGRQRLFLVEGPPGASRMMKNESVTSTNSVGTSPTMRRSA